MTSPVSYEGYSIVSEMSVFSVLLTNTTSNNNNEKIENINIFLQLLVVISCFLLK